MGCREECHSRGNRGGGLGWREKQGAVAGEGWRRRGAPPQESPRTCAGSQRAGHLWHRLQVVRGHLLWVLETRSFLSRLCGWATFVGAKSNGGLSLMWCLFCDLQAAGTNRSSPFRNQREVMARH